MLGIRSRLRPMIRVEILVLMVVAWLVATANGAWWSVVNEGRDWARPSSWLFMISGFALIVALHFALIVPFAIRWITRPLLTVLVVASASAAYFMRTYAVILDPSMIQNVLHTDKREARELINLGLVAWVLAWSALPVAFIWLVRLQREPPLRALLVRVGSVLAACLIAGLALFTISRDLTSFMRNEHEARYLITPGNILVGLVRISAHRVQDAKAPRETVGGDARLADFATTDGRARVLVLVVGETARAANFSLFGYPRDTNPELAKTDVTAFSNVTSCGTSTEVSVPCMFSPFGRADYDERRIRNSEGLLDVLTRAGYIVKWIDNQSGCKGVCQGNGIEYEKTAASLAPDLCSDNECHDEILPRLLSQELSEVRGKTVFVLHMMGNHGPAYFKRYPPQFRRFVPDCQTAELRDCSREEVVNAYDNAILYTDHVLAMIIGTLASDPSHRDSAMLYVSDHGESLGERGLYLHGIPYAIAPELQTHVPMLVWVSQQLKDSGDVNERCLRDKSQAALSHDNIFHSMLGLADIDTAAYQPARDIFDGCRGGPAGAFAQSRSSAARGG
jgi:lipid A ethanolaminephosphotransferase